MVFISAALGFCRVLYPGYYLSSQTEISESLLTLLVVNVGVWNFPFFCWLLVFLLQKKLVIFL
jgi:hypothetical protein